MRTVVYIGLFAIASALGFEATDLEAKIMGIILGMVLTMDVWEFFYNITRKK